MKNTIMSIVFIILMMIPFGIFTWSSLHNQIDEENQCSEKLYGILVGMRYSYPEVYDVVSEVARVHDFSCKEYLTFLDNMRSGNQKK